MKNQEGDDVHIPNQLPDAIKKGFERSFWEIWYRGQTPEEREKKWLPEKRPAQVAEEFLEYLYLVCDCVDPAVLEIGVAQGQQRRFYEDLLGCRKYIGVDILEGPADIIGNSQDPRIVQSLQESEPFGWDIIFLDGNHTREGVKADYEVYKEMVRPGGYLALHDTHHDHWEGADGAAVLWPTIRRLYENTWDIFHKCDYTPYHKGTNDRKQCGIGLIQMPTGEIDESIADDATVPVS